MGLRFLFRVLELVDGAEQGYLLSLFTFRDRFRVALQQVQSLSGLLRDVGHVLELLLPILGDLDGGLLVVDPLGRHPLLAGVLHDLHQIVGIHGVEYVEEILTRRTLIFWKNRRKVLSERLIFL